jgi:hypothetical protein
MHRSGAAALTAFVLTSSALVSADDWPQWRGPLGTGVTTETNLPERWNGTENVAWRADLGGVGVSSPIVLGNRVFVTSQILSRATRQDPRLPQGGSSGAAEERSIATGLSGAGDPVLLVEAFDASSGSRLWQYRLPAEGPMPTVHDKANMASPSHAKPPAEQLSRAASAPYPAAKPAAGEAPLDAAGAAP